MRRAGVLVLAGILAAASAVQAARSDRELDQSFKSRALGGRLHYEVYLPPGYATSGKRYPVVYFLHGLPSSATAYRAAGFVENALDETGGDRAILVAPQGARWNEPDPEYVDHGPGDRWEAAIAGELVRTIDARFRTVASRRGRALIGLSAGGFGAMHIALAHLSTFAVVESWSGYFHPTDPTGTKGIDLGPHNDVHRQLLATRTTLRRLHTFVGFYIGNADGRFVAENRQLHRELTSAGIPHLFRVYAGAHNQRLWQRHAPAWLSLALAHLQAPR
jgi:enterochelin esterase-like enzyme